MSTRSAKFVEDLHTLSGNQDTYAKVIEIATAGYNKQQLQSEYSQQIAAYLSKFLPADQPPVLLSQTPGQIPGMPGFPMPGSAMSQFPGGNPGMNPQMGMLNQGVPGMNSVPGGQFGMGAPAFMSQIPGTVSAGGKESAKYSYQDFISMVQSGKKVCSGTYKSGDKSGCYCCATITDKTYNPQKPMDQQLCSKHGEKKPKGAMGAAQISNMHANFATFGQGGGMPQSLASQFGGMIPGVSQVPGMQQQGGMLNQQGLPQIPGMNPSLGMTNQMSQPGPQIPGLSQMPQSGMQIPGMSQASQPGMQIPGMNLPQGISNNIHQSIPGIPGMTQGQSSSLPNQMTQSGPQIPGLSQMPQSGMQIPGLSQAPQIPGLNSQSMGSNSMTQSIPQIPGLSQSSMMPPQLPGTNLPSQATPQLPGMSQMSQPPQVVPQLSNMSQMGAPLIPPNGSQNSLPLTGGPQMPTSTPQLPGMMQSNQAVPQLPTTSQQMPQNLSQVPGITNMNSQVPVIPGLGLVSQVSQVPSNATPYNPSVPQLGIHQQMINSHQANPNVGHQTPTSLATQGMQMQQVSGQNPFVVPSSQTQILNAPVIPQQSANQTIQSIQSQVHTNQMQIPTLQQAPSSVSVPDITSQFSTFNISSQSQLQTGKSEYYSRSMGSDNYFFTTDPVGNGLVFIDNNGVKVCIGEVRIPVENRSDKPLPETFKELITLQLSPEHEAWLSANGIQKNLIDIADTHGDVVSQEA